MMLGLLVVFLVGRSSLSCRRLHQNLRKQPRDSLHTKDQLPHHRHPPRTKKKTTMVRKRNRKKKKKKKMKTKKEKVTD